MAEVLLGILKNESNEAHLLWKTSCEKCKIDFKVIDLLKHDWYNGIVEYNFCSFLACPPGFTERFRKLYDERIFLIEHGLQKMVYPSFNEISLHENKRYLASY